MLKIDKIQGILHERYDEVGNFSVYISSMAEYWKFAELFAGEVKWMSGRDLCNPDGEVISRMQERSARGVLYLNFEWGCDRLAMFNSNGPSHHPVFTMESLLSIRKRQQISDSKWEELLWI